MTPAPTLSLDSSAQHPPTRIGAWGHPNRGPDRRAQDPSRRRPRARPARAGGPRPLGRYTDRAGRRREVVCVRRQDSCLLVLDRDTRTGTDRRLVAELAEDEPPRNAAIVCAHYLRDERRGRCRALTAEDLAGERTGAGRDRIGPAPGPVQPVEVCGQHEGASQAVFSLRPAPSDAGASELRWHSRPRAATGGPSRVLSLREVIGELESYEPVCALTGRALKAERDQTVVSTAVLRAELERVRTSPIVLNRKLRQAVLGAIDRQGLSMSEIALRCGRVKRESKGARSGETSWLARRVGLLPESGSGRRTPWIHSSVLALIARDGLGISPLEVELG